MKYRLKNKKVKDISVSDTLVIPVGDQYGYSVNEDDVIELLPVVQLREVVRVEKVDGNISITAGGHTEKYNPDKCLDVLGEESKGKRIILG